MPKQYACDMCETNIADFSLSATATGDTQLLCFRCLPGFVEAMVAAVDAAANTPAEPAVTAAEPAEGGAGEWEYDHADPHPKSNGQAGSAHYVTAAEAAEAAASADD